jgi:hypothetical protein
MRSLAVEACPDPDVIDIQALRLPSGVTTDPQWWLHEMFQLESRSVGTRLLFGARRLLALVVWADARPDFAEVFAVDAVRDHEVMAHEADRHLDFWLGVATEDGTLRVTSVVRLHGWRGRLYWLPVAALHGPVTRRVMRRALRRATS